MDLDTLPPFSTLWLVGGVTLAALESWGIISPYYMFYSPQFVFKRRQYWRLITSFMYFGPLNLNLLFNLFYYVRFAFMLESQTFGSTRRAEYAWLLLCASLATLLIGSACSIRFLSEPLYWLLMYVWSRKNRHLRVGFFGLIVISAAYLPILELFLGYFNGSFGDGRQVLGLVLGHIYYVATELWPREYEGMGQNWLQPPQVWYVCIDLTRHRLSLFGTRAN
ncbi:hypothetical protein Malapachy_2121 [Malassezia pachydermatis]|uniref:Derlin n=1 Tax=Malassezia pachydermatis TaxID=77020 RepID=A0A0M8MRB7_9BASI|nr:hypothetical protein Malapachy_2121 [Malassezia pachydermatis]KOS15237.1 hypothetical protein Malapachy_2121 [Malassezia pachydermatis]